MNMTKQYRVIYWKNSHKYSLRVACMDIQDVINHMDIFHDVPVNNIVSIKEV